VRTERKTDGRSNGRTDGRTDKQTDERTDGRTDGGTNGQTNGRTNGGTDGRTHGWTNGRTDKRTDGQTDRQDITELKVAFRNFINAPKNTHTGICILYHAIQSCRINHLMTQSGNDYNSYAKEHEIEKQLATRQKGFVPISFAKISKQNNHSKLFIVDVAN
jgi:hypothetical protein